MLRPLIEILKRAIEEDPHFESQQDEKEHATLDKIISNFEAVLSCDLAALLHPAYGWGKCLIADRETIEKFIDALPGYDKKGDYHFAGALLSGLLYNLDEKDLTLDLTRLTRPVGFLGAFLSSRNLTINGDSDSCLGCFMKSGELTLKGHGGDTAGWAMKGGLIIVEGDAGNYTGYKMTQGRIIIKGNAGECAGYEMGEKYYGESSIIIEGSAGAKVGSGMRAGEIMVTRNAGDEVGYEMQGGKIVICGYARNDIGNSMAGGEIVIKGNCWDNLGHNMRYGKITVEGNAGLSVGKGMTGGEIHINGEFKSIDTFTCQGTIYHRGKQIYHYPL